VIAAFALGDFQHNTQNAESLGRSLAKATFYFDRAALRWKTNFDRGVPPKSLGFDGAMRVRKFCEKILEPTRAL
jgi:hypothetical protein